MVLRGLSRQKYGAREPMPACGFVVQFDGRPSAEWSHEVVETVTEAVGEALLQDLGPIEHVGGLNEAPRDACREYTRPGRWG